MTYAYFLKCVTVMAVMVMPTVMPVMRNAVMRNGRLYPEGACASVQLAAMNDCLARLISSDVVMIGG